MPMTAARRMYSPIAVRPIPTDRAITRSLAPHAYFRRRTSRTFRIDNLSAGIGSPLRIAKKDRAQLRLPTALPASPFQHGGRIASESVAIGMDGRFPSEPVAALPRILQRRHVQA